MPKPNILFIMTDNQGGVDSGLSHGTGSGLERAGIGGLRLALMRRGFLLVR